MGAYAEPGSAYATCLKPLLTWMSSRKEQVPAVTSSSRSKSPQGPLCSTCASSNSSCSSSSRLLCSKPSCFPPAGPSAPHSLPTLLPGLGKRVWSSKPWGRGSHRKPEHSCSSPSSLLGIVAPWDSCRTGGETWHGSQADAGGIGFRNCATSFAWSAGRSDMVAEFDNALCQEEQKRQPREEEVWVTKRKWAVSVMLFVADRYNHFQQWKARPEIVWFASKGVAGFDTHQSSLVPSCCTLQRASMPQHRAGVFLWSSHAPGTLCGQGPDQGSKED